MYVIEIKFCEVIIETTLSVSVGEYFLLIFAAIILQVIIQVKWPLVDKGQNNHDIKIYFN